MDVLVIGGGVAGLSTAYHLAKSGQRSVLVLEQEMDLGGHASGRNAGMLRQALADPVLASLAARSRREFSRAAKAGWKGLELKPNGSLLLSKSRDAGKLEDIENTLGSLGLRSRWLSRKEAAKKAPPIESGDFERAFFCPSDALVDIGALLNGFLRQLKTLGVRVRRGQKLWTVHPADGGFLVHAGGEKWFCQRIVNAAGAWAGWVAEKAGASPVPLTAYRRHLYLTAPDASPKDRWPFVWDLSRDFYFRPLGRRIMISPCDKTPEARGDRREKVNTAMRAVMDAKLRAFSTPLADARIERVQSGLRTMAPDGRFVIGEDAKLKRFYWVAGLGGHGVTACFSVGELASALILGKKTDAQVASALSPSRFSEVFHAA